MKKSNILTFVTAIAIIFTFANFNSAQTQRESQLGTLCKQFRDYNDCKEYLKDYPNGNTASFAKSIVDNREANSGQKTVEDKYWDLVKNSTKADDFKTYLKEYPNGKYASLARQKINGGSSSTSLFTFKATTAMTNEAYMERLEDHMISQLPIKIGEYEIYRAKAPTSLEDYFYTSVRATKSGPPANLGRQISPLKAQLTPDYCKSELAQRKITMAFSWDGTNFSEQFRPSDCATSTTKRNVPVSMELSLQTAIQTGANGRNRIPISRNDPAINIEGEGILWNPAIYVDVNFSDGTKIGPHDYKRNFANNLVFDDVSGDPNDLIKVEYWDIDSSNPQAGKYAAQLASTGKGTGTAYLKVSLRDNPNVTSSVKVEIISGANAGQLSDAEFLNKWAAEVRVGLPESIAGYQLTNAWSRCPVGCKEKDSPTYLLLKLDTEGEQQYAGIADLKQDLLPSLLQVYCQTEAPRRKIMLGVFFDNRGQQADYNNFWVNPEDCSAN